MIVFVDTNILLDVLGRREPFWAHGAGLWALAEAGVIRAYVSAMSFNNVFYALRKQYGKKEALKSLREMRNIFEIVSVDRRIVDRAMDCGMADFEDAIQYYSALRSRARFLITRNARDFPQGEPVVLSAEEFLAVADWRGGKVR